MKNTIRPKYRCEYNVNITLNTSAKVQFFSFTYKFMPIKK